MLQDDHGNNTLLTANGPFTFSTPLAYGTPYNVTVLANPTAPAQTCTVTNGLGIVGYANVTSVAVVCA